MWYADFSGVFANVGNLGASIGASITKLFQARDELSIRNIRGSLWPALLIFPLSVIMGDLRYFDISLTVLGLQSYELMLFSLGFGWLVIALTPRRFLLKLLWLAAICSAILLAFQMLAASETARLAAFIGFQFFNGISAACSFYLFCFVLNNVERLFGMGMIQVYYGFYYTFWRVFPSVAGASETWGGVVAMVLYLVVAIACGRKQREYLSNEMLATASTANTVHLSGEMQNTGKSPESIVYFVIGLDVVYYITMCMISYISYEENTMSSLIFGIGSFVSIGLIVLVQLLNNRSALYIWGLFLALSVLGLGALLYDSHITLIFGSFTYGLGNGLGYIIIYYICAGAIKQSKSFKMFRLYCLMFFVEYFAISGIFSALFRYFNGPNRILAFSIVLILGCFCLMIMPLMQRRLFVVDWTDGLYLHDLAEYSKPLAQVEEIIKKDDYNLTPREEELFLLLLEGKAPKEAAYLLKVSYETVHFHQKNLYRKLGIQSRAELFARFPSQFDEKEDENPPHTV